MTTLINLESYLECCQLAHLFAEDSAKLIPSLNSLPIAYLNFCRRHQSQSFLAIPATTIAQPKNLIPRQGQLPQQNIGLVLPDNSLEQILIVREANSLILRPLQSRYIYANVYRYWSFAEQLQQFTHSDKQLVIYDLDSFTPSQIIPLTFQNYGNAPYPIPIVDTRPLKEYDKLKLSQSYESVYDKICLTIANKIVQDLKLDLDNLSKVANYIKKINLFQNKTIEFTSSDYISLILEINYRFYSYSLFRTDVDNIVHSHFPITSLNKIITENPNYHFALLSSYTMLPGIRTALQRRFQTSLLILDPSINNLPKTWQQKLDNNFALFGQSLDRISFFVKKSGEEIEIRLPEKICYEGEQEIIVYGRYLKDGELRENFPLKTSEVTLPFRINHEPFLDSETGVEQVYKIENQYFDQTPNLDVKICFCLKPGHQPRLQVLDNYNRVIDSKLIDLEQSRVKVSQTLGFIPMSQILRSRENKSIMASNLLIESGFTRDLQLFSKFISTITKSTSSREISNQISRLRGICKHKLLPILTLTKESNLASTLQSYSDIGKLIESIFKRLDPSKKPDPDIRHLVYTARLDLLLILGDSYALTNQMNLDFLFNIDVLSQPKNKAINLDNQLRCIAKISCSKHRQSLYLSIFHKHTEYRGKDFYKTDEYIWGYARLLLWYSNMTDHSLILTYNKHFLAITNHCLNLNPNIAHEKSYMRDALIALIYLLTFREVDSRFVERDSELYIQSKKLCKKLLDSPILSRKAGVELPLNQFFAQLLDASVTQEQVNNMIEID